MIRLKCIHLKYAAYLHLLIEWRNRSSTPPRIFRSWSGSVEVAAIPKAGRTFNRHCSCLYIVDAKGNPLRRPFHLISVWEYGFWL